MFIYLIESESSYFDGWLIRSGEYPIFHRPSVLQARRGSTSIVVPICNMTPSYRRGSSINELLLSNTFLIQPCSQRNTIFNPYRVPTAVITLTVCEYGGPLLLANRKKYPRAILQPNRACLFTFLIFCFTETCPVSILNQLPPGTGVIRRLSPRRFVCTTGHRPTAAVWMNERPRSRAHHCIHR